MSNLQLPNKPYPPRKHKGELVYLKLTPPNTMRNFLDSIIVEDFKSLMVKPTVPSRQETNTQILALMKQYLSENPDQRFWQALLNCGVISLRIDEESGKVEVVDEYNLESTTILKRMEAVLF